MRKRLRKKKRLGEFQEFGFKVGFVFANYLNAKTADDLFDKFLTEAIENNSLLFGGIGGNGKWDGFVTVSNPRGSATDFHRRAVEKWLSQEPTIAEYCVSPLIDAWYGNPKHSAP